MTAFDRLLTRLGADLERHEARWAVVGGHSVSIRSEPRFTKDLDVAIAVGTDAEAEHLVQALVQSGYGIRAVLEQTATKRLATVRLTPPGSPEGPVIDLLFASSGIEPELVQAAEMMEVFPGTKAPVATLAHLIALKILSRDDTSRPQDRIDLHNLLKGATPDDIGAARDALKLITQRESNRGRDLQALLDQALHDLLP